MASNLSRTTLVYRDGILLDVQTAALWALLKKRFPGLILTQGVKSGAAASSGTHLGLGVLDLYLGRHAGEWKAVLKYAFEIGFFGWYRPAIAGVWKTHIHLGVRGNPYMAGSLKVQQVSWTNGRNGLKGNGRDAYTWRPANYKKAAPWPIAAPKPPKPAKPIKPWFNVGFLNAAGNGKVLWKTFKKRLPKTVKVSTAGLPAIHGFAEVQPGQRGDLTRALEPSGYRLIGKDDGNMLAVYGRSNVTDVSSSFARFKQQDGGNVEGVLRVRFKVDGSWAQVGLVHLDYNSSEAKKRSNLREAVAALQRYGATRMGNQWKKRTVLFGDFNDSDVAAKVLVPLGFREIEAGGSIDQIWVGKERAVRGGSKTAGPFEKFHPRIVGRLGRS